jgi:mannitol-1-phosphate 5-dehydrogenase
MNHQNEKIVIWGAGKIGRGFIADLYSNAGFKITFVDADAKLVEKLKNKKSYSLCHMYSDGTSKCSKIGDYDVLHISEAEKLSRLMTDVAVLSVSVFPKHFEDVARDLAQFIQKRKQDGVQSPLNMLLCSNIFEPGVKMDKAIRSFLDEESISYYEQFIGIAECIVIRMVVPPSERQLAEDELVVVTNGYPELIVDKAAWKGVLPDVPGIRMTDDIVAFEARKLFTYNMLHALYSYVGQRKGLQYVYDCTKDPEVQYIAQHALDEVLDAVKMQYNADQEDVAAWRRGVLANMANPSLHDELPRVGADPVRKLAREDRLTGAALLCMNNGMMPYYLVKAIAAGILYANEQDEKSLEIARYLKKEGIRKTVIHYCGLDREPELVQMVCEECERIMDGKLFETDRKVVDLLKKAYTAGFKMEKTYRGCGQCILLALYEMLGTSDDALFREASALSGGMGLCGDGACGGYVCGILFMGKYAGRRRDEMLADGDKAEQYLSYDMAQELHDMIKETYGDVVCKDIHKRIFGRDYCLRTKPVRDAFEEAGAHTVKCTGVIALISTFVIRILLKYGFVKA